MRGISASTDPAACINTQGFVPVTGCIAASFVSKLVSNSLSWKVVRVHLNLCASDFSVYVYIICIIVCPGGSWIRDLKPGSQNLFHRETKSTHVPCVCGSALQRSSLCSFKSAAGWGKMQYSILYCSKKGLHSRKVLNLQTKNSGRAQKSFRDF